MEKIRVHLYITGLVQGVFFRARTKDQADKLGVYGWVKNLYDGRVEVVCEGEKNDVENLINWCRQGPKEANVSDINVSYEESTNKFSSFDIRY